MYFPQIILISGIFVAWQLVDGVRQVQVCQFEWLNINCLEDQRIAIRLASYERYYSYYCNNNPWTNLVTNCNGTAQSFNAVSYWCNYKRTCWVYVNDNILGDPCPHMYKYLEVSYDCVDADLDTKVACETENIDIDCGSKKIVINDATFGRTKPMLCFNNGNYTSSLTCKAPKATSIVATQCNGKQKCRVESSTKLFGDPCKGVNKYLEVKYECI